MNHETDTFARTFGVLKTTTAAVLLSSALIALVGCTAHSSLVPLERGQVAPLVAFGGPMVEAFDTHIPVPWLAAGGDVGIGKRTNATAIVHLLPLVYRVAGADVGATWFPTGPWDGHAEVGVGARLVAFASLKADVDRRFLVYPVLTATTSRPVGRGRLFAGTDVAIPLDRPEFDAEAVGVIVSPFIGYQWPIGRRLALVTELKWNGANVRSDRLVAGYTGIGTRGAVTPLLALQRRF